MRMLHVFAALLALAATPAGANERLRLADSLPIGHFFAVSGTKVFMDRVQALSGGTVTFDYFPAEQLGKAKDLLSLTVSGVVDIGYVVPSYVSDRMPLSAVAELPGSFKTACEGTKAYFDLAESGVLRDFEFVPNKVKTLFALVTPPYQLFTTREKIVSVATIAGLKLRTTGGAMDATVRYFNGIPIRMAAPDMYQGLSRGTVDGTLFPYSSVISYDLAGLIHYATSDENLGSAVLTYVISLDRWARLSPKVQAVLQQAGREATEQACKAADADVARDIATLRAKGVTIGPFPEADRPALRQAANAVAAEWSTDLDKRGKPGTQVLDSFRAALGQGR